MSRFRNDSLHHSATPGIARALQLNLDEKLHLFSLAQQPLPTPSPPEDFVTPALQTFLNSLQEIPGYILGRRWDILAWNSSACAVFNDFSQLPPSRRNFIWYLFTNRAIQEQLVDWEGFAQCMLAKFRLDCDRHLSWEGNCEFIETLQQVSPEFNEWWNRHDVLRRTQW
ncbi:MAG: hypothetical protein HC835_16175 [Oscillatoriales cyanobacterium RM2_1_1]|nr:hypothetical protein [Oscillatoriales cyanobacterium SM2_3_0]NJO47027.1 hypothetical protein [Oscillatoriales cyanobacterium RM2_1_1]